MSDTLTTYNANLFTFGVDLYRSYLKTLIWGQERSLELTKDLLVRSENFQKDGLKLVEEYTANLTNSAGKLQDAVNDTWKKATETFQQYGETTVENLQNASKQFSDVQEKVVESVNSAASRATRNSK